ncbi:hypothetical protein [Leyella stercorea]|uniref:hypothetical protein n=1 Tax=Leyella stercorea TaxID=363265 RepID=UPI00242ECB47|nr:hypothetical protein [Leyella stercorea]
MQKEVLLIASAPTDADVCTDRRGCLHRPTRMSASTDADVCTDRRRCLHRPMRAMKVLLLISSPSRTVG